MIHFIVEYRKRICWLTNCINWSKKFQGYYEIIYHGREIVLVVICKMSVAIKMNFLLFFCFVLWPRCMVTHRTNYSFINQYIYIKNRWIRRFENVLPNQIINQAKCKAANMVIEFSEYVMYFICHRVAVLWQPKVNTKLQVKTIKINPNSCISIDKYSLKKPNPHPRQYLHTITKHKHR